MESANSMVFVSERLRTTAESAEVQTKKAYTIPCHSEMDGGMARSMKAERSLASRINRHPLSTDPRRPEKNHYLALQAGEILERRGWIVGMTTLKQQPRSIVWDRMIVADVTLITSQRESDRWLHGNPSCVERRSLTNVGDVATYLPKEFVIDNPTPEALANACELLWKRIGNVHQSASKECHRRWCRNNGLRCFKALRKKNEQTDSY